MKNEYWYRYFLVVNKMANEVMGHEPQNFALLIKEEQMGRFGNAQMTKFFDAIDTVLSSLTCNDPRGVFDVLDLDELADLSIEQIEDDFNNYCDGKLKFDFRQD